MIRFRIKRERAIAGALLSWSFFIGGKRVPRLKNGGGTTVSVKKERVIFLQDEGSIVKNAVVFPSGSEIGLSFRLAGSFKKGYRRVFSADGNACPSVSFARLFSGLEKGGLSEKQRELALLAKVMEAFDSEELLRSKHIHEMLAALKRLDARLYAGTLERAMNACFPGADFPIVGGEEDEELQERFRAAEFAMLEADEKGRLTEELHRTAANFIAANFGELFTEEDLYYFDGSKELLEGPEPLSLDGPIGRAPKKKPNIPRLAVTILLFLAFEAGAFLLWRNASYYPARAALPENSYAVTVSDPQVSIVESNKNGPVLLIEAEGEAYRLVLEDCPSFDMDREALREALEAEEELTLTVRGEQSVAGIGSRERTYLSVEAFNKAQRFRCGVGTFLLVFFALAGAFVFLLALIPVFLA